MNGISWLIYLSDIAGNIQAVTGIAGLVLFMILVIMTFVTSAIQDAVSFPPHAGRWTLVASLFVCVSVFMPSQRTVTLIAASELGERLSKNPDVAQLYDSIRAKILESLNSSKR